MPGKSFRTKLLITALVLVTAIIVVLLLLDTDSFSMVQTKILPDGSVLILSGVSFTGTHPLIHGNHLEKVLRNAIPSNGIAWSKFKLARPTARTFSPPDGKSWLIAEFKLASTNAQGHPLVNPFYHQFRCLIHGGRGIDYVQEFLSGKFEQYSDGYFGYVIASRYPRDATWLWLRIESRARQATGGPWSPVAEFKIKNKSPFGPQTMASTPLVTNVSVGELSLTVEGITVVTQAFSPRDMWNHVVTAQFRVASNGLPLTNWDQPYVRVEGASGNWDYHLASHRSLDPRYVWKLDADFEPVSDFAEGSVLKMPLPRAGTTITTTFSNLPVSIFWDGDWVDVRIPTNRPDGFSTGSTARFSMEFHVTG